MKRAAFIFTFLFVIAFMFLFTQFSLKDLTNINNNVLSYKSVDLGFIVEEFVADDYKIYKSGEDVVGECLTIKANLLDLNRITDKLGVMITNKYNVEDTFILEGVSSKLKFSIDNRQPNVQIAVSGDKITIASPIIYGSY